MYYTFLINISNVMYGCFLHVLKKKPGVHIGIYMDIKIVVVSFFFVWREIFVWWEEIKFGIFLIYRLNNEIVY